MEDKVNHPNHYTSGDIECIDAMKAASSGIKMPAFWGYLWLNVFKYLWRWWHKGYVESLKKARWYLDRLIYEIEHPRPKKRKRKKQKGKRKK